MARSSSLVTALALLAGVLLLVAPSVGQAKDPQRVPKRLSSVGDSITEAINAEEFNPFVIITPNHWASWANGYHGFWEWLLGRTNVHSHNQRITSAFGSRNRKNYMEAVSGADSFDLAPQMGQSVSHAADYVSVFMGHNDVCQDSFSDIPTDAQFEANVRAGFDQLEASLPNGATVYTLAIVDIYKLWELGPQLSGFLGISCETIWATTLLGIFPCGTMLNPLNSEADRQYTRSRNIAFNQILEDLVAEYDANDTHHYWEFSDLTFETEFVPSEVSPFDCFHPSAEGQTRLSEESWLTGPFGGY
jgi:lysophospholipase L1-like esterase